MLKAFKADILRIIFKNTIPFFQIVYNKRHIPVDTGRKLNVHKTFRRRPGRLLDVLCTFNLCPMSMGVLLSLHIYFLFLATITLLLCPMFSKNSLELPSHSFLCLWSYCTWIGLSRTWGWFINNLKWNIRIVLKIQSNIQNGGFCENS